LLLLPKFLRRPPSAITSNRFSKSDFSPAGLGSTNSLCPPSAIGSDGAATVLIPLTVEVVVVVDVVIVVAVAVALMAPLLDFSSRNCRTSSLSKDNDDDDDDDDDNKLTAYAVAI